MQRIVVYFMHCSTDTVNTVLLRSPNSISLKRAAPSNIMLALRDLTFKLRTPFLASFFSSGQTLMSSLVEAVGLDYIEVWYVGLYNCNHEYKNNK